MNDKPPISFLKKWWIYQKERFPLAGHAPLIFSFSFCAVSYSSHLRGNGWPELSHVIIAFITCLLFFLQLRIADEFKDAEEDLKYRPYRAVPRGLIKLSELRNLFIIAGVIQVGLAYYHNAYLLIALLFAWAYLASMSFEFGARKWLKAHPIIYLLSHMLIMPIVDFYATAVNWISVTHTVPHNLHFFLITSFFNGLVIEIGRKIRTKNQEEEGVESYSFLWGTNRATWIWFALLVTTFGFAIPTAAQIGTQLYVGGFLFVILILILCYLISFTNRPTDKKAKGIELIAGLWTIVLYLSIGVLTGIL